MECASVAFVRNARARAVAHEALAAVRQALLMPLDLAPILPPICDDANDAEDAAPASSNGEDVVVLVHGFLASAGVFRPLRRRLETELGAHVASFTHVPGAGVQRIALSLAKIVDRIPKRARVHLVGHSLGGLVARWYVEELGGHQRVTQTIALAAPFGGAPAAARFPYLVGLDLVAHSPVLRRLRDVERLRHDVPHCSIVGDVDRVVYPSESAAFAHGEHIVLTGRGHNALLFDDQVARIVVERIRRARAGARTRVDDAA